MNDINLFIPQKKDTNNKKMNQKNYLQSQQIQLDKKDQKELSSSNNDGFFSSQNSYFLQQNNINQINKDCQSDNKSRSKKMDQRLISLSSQKKKTQKFQEINSSESSIDRNQEAVQPSIKSSLKFQNAQEENYLNYQSGQQIDQSESSGKSNDNSSIQERKSNSSYHILVNQKSNVKKRIVNDFSESSFQSDYNSNESKLQEDQQTISYSNYLMGSKQQLINNVQQNKENVQNIDQQNQDLKRNEIQVEIPQKSLSNQLTANNESKMIQQNDKKLKILIILGVLSIIIIQLIQFMIQFDINKQSTKYLITKLVFQNFKTQYISIIVLMIVAAAVQKFTLQNKNSNFLYLTIFIIIPINMRPFSYNIAQSQNQTFIFDQNDTDKNQILKEFNHVSDILRYLYVSIVVYYFQKYQSNYIQQLQQIDNDKTQYIEAFIQRYLCYLFIFSIILAEFFQIPNIYQYFFENQKKTGILIYFQLLRVQILLVALLFIKIKNEQQKDLNIPVNIIEPKQELPKIKVEEKQIVIQECSQSSHSISLNDDDSSSIHNTIMQYKSNPLNQNTEYFQLTQQQQKIIKSEQIQIDINRTTNDDLFNKMNNISMLCMRIPNGSINPATGSFRRSKSMNIKTQIVLEIYKLSKLFFNEIPNSKDNIKDIEFIRPLQQKSNHLRKEKSLIFKDLKNMFADNKQSLKRSLYFYQLQNQYHEILEQQLYEPYFISNNTILQYQNQDSNKKLSFCQIIQEFINESKNQSKLYFKVGNDQLKDPVIVLKKKMSQISIIKKLSQKNTKNQKNQSFEEENQNELSPYYTNEKENFWKNKSMQIKDVEYFEFDLKKFDIDRRKLSVSLHTTMLELLDLEQFQRIQEQNNTFILINIRNISNVVKSQQKLSDQMYLDATEQNYSHEQMTPLNSILANSKIIYKRFQEIMQQQQNHFKEKNDNDNYEKAKRKNEESLKILKAIQQSGQIMWYYNQNQIQRMKIKKNEFIKKKTLTKNIEEHIERVINPFEPQITSRNLKIFIAKKRNFNFIIKNDWIMYQLTLFNIIQNAVKYNIFEGNIIILLDCKPKKIHNDINQQNEDSFQEEDTHVFETEIIDTGIGISEERQNMLFIPFMELKMRQNLTQVKDHNIGMGLGCSQQIVSQLGGDITVKSSKRGLTIFAFKVPVSVQKIQRVEQAEEKSNVSIISSQELSNMIVQSNNIQLNHVDPLEVNKEVLQYISKLKINQSLKKLKLADIELPPEKCGQMLQIMNLKTKNFDKFNKKLVKSNSDKFQDNNQIIPQEIKIADSQKGIQLFQSDINFKSDIVNEQNLDLKKIRSNSFAEFSKKNKLQLKSEKNYKINDDNILKKSPQNLKKLEMLNIKQNKNLNSSQSRSLDKHQLNQDDEESPNQNNQKILKKLQNQINIEIQDSISEKIISQIKNKSDKLKKHRNHSISGARNNNINNLQIKNHSVKIILQNQGINYSKLSNLKQSIKNKVKKQQKQLLKPSNPLTKPESQLQILNKNINKDLQENEKKQLAINILINNHRDSLQQKLKFDLRNINQEIEEDLIIQKSNGSQDEDESVSSLDDSKVLDIVINDANIQNIIQYKQVQQLSFLQSIILQLQQNKFDHIKHFQNIYSNSPIDQVVKQNKQEIVIEQNNPILNFDVLNQNKSVYFEDNESENSLKFNFIRSQEFKLADKLQNSQDDLILFEQNSKQNKNRLQLSQIQELDDEAIEERKNSKMLDLQQNKIEDEENKQQYNDQIYQIINRNLESIKEIQSQAENENSEKSNIINGQNLVNHSKNGLKIRIQDNNEEEKKEQTKKELRMRRSIRIGLMSQNRQLSKLSNQKLLQLPELEIPEYLQNENGCSCIPKILIVDDIEFNIIPVKMLIKENFDIDVEIACNGAIALQKYKDLIMSPCGCENRTYSLIFMDLQMPVMGGLESSQKILNFMLEQNLKNSGSLIQKVETSIVVLSAFSDNKIKNECLEAGIKKFLNKPLHYQQLHKIMSLYYYKIKKEQYREIFKETFNKSYTSSQY